MRLSAFWELYKAPLELVKVAKLYGVKLTMFHVRGGIVGRVNGSLQVTVQGGVIEQSLYEKLLVSKYLWAFGEKLRTKYEETKSLVLQTVGHKDLLEGYCRRFSKHRSSKSLRESRLLSLSFLSFLLKNNLFFVLNLK